MGPTRPLQVMALTSLSLFQVTAQISSIRLIVIQPFFRELLLFVSDLKTIQNSLAPPPDSPGLNTVKQVRSSTPS